jgi:DNA-binding transcriptional MerR regulator
MFRIGELSKLSKVSVKALRHYDDLGLLAPASVDRFTSYRYYTADQLPRLNRILALKDLGLSLEEIRRLLAEGPPAAELRGMLRIKQAEVDAEVCEPVDAPLDAVGHVKVYDLTACSVAATVHHGSHDGLNGAYGALMSWIGANGYRITGANREIYLRNRADHKVESDDFVTEVQFPVAKG